MTFLMIRCQETPHHWYCLSLLLLGVTWPFLHQSVYEFRFKQLFVSNPLAAIRQTTCQEKIRDETYSNIRQNMKIWCSVRLKNHQDVHKALYPVSLWSWPYIHVTVPDLPANNNNQNWFHFLKVWKKQNKTNKVKTVKTSLLYSCYLKITLKHVDLWGVALFCFVFSFSHLYQPSVQSEQDFLHLWDWVASLLSCV